MAHGLFSFTFFLGPNPTEIPRTALSYTLKIKTRVRPVDSTDQTFAFSQNSLCMGTESYKPHKTAKDFHHFTIFENLSIPDACLALSQESQSSIQLALDTFMD